MRGMKGALLLLGALLSTTAKAGSSAAACPACPDSGYKTVTTTCYETVTKCNQPDTVYKTEYKTAYNEKTVTEYKEKTVTDYKEKTVYQEKTVTNYNEKTVTQYNEKTVTQYNEKTVYVTSGYPVPTTVVQNQPVTVRVTVTETVVVSATVVNDRTIVNTVTAVDTVQVQNTVTAENTVTAVNTVAVQNTVTNVNTVQVQNTVTVTQVVSAACPTSTPLVGLVTCPSRIINPTYTPPTPLPSTYLWGCPPGTICTPPQENCNFEQNPPAFSYVCSPDQCQPVKQLPSLQQYLSYVDGGSTCAWLPPLLGYFNLNPIPFGYSFAIFDVYGQPVCPASSSKAPPPPPSKTYSSSTWATWSAPAKQSSEKPSPSTWNAWASKVTARAELVDRAALYPMPCYTICNIAQLIFQSIGYDSNALCPKGGDFDNAYSSLVSCTSASSDYTPLAAATVVDAAYAFCGTVIMKKRSLEQEIALLSPATTTAASVPTNSPSSSPAGPVTSSAASSAAAASSSAAASARSSGIADRASGETSVWLTMLLSFLGLIFHF